MLPSVRQNKLKDSPLFIVLFIDHTGATPGPKSSFEFINELFAVNEKRYCI